jgi:uncharacterized protein (TIRG00374 family)
MNYMINPETNKRQSRPLLTIIAIGLMILVGAFIIFLDRNEVRQLAGKVSWGYIGIAFSFMAVTYLCQSASTVVMIRVFGVNLDKFYLLRLGLVSSVLSNLIALPASLALRMLVLGRRGVAQSQIVGSSLLLSYFKNVTFYALIPASLIYLIFTYPLVLGGIAAMAAISLILVAVIAVATVIVFNRRIRTAVLRMAGRLWRLIVRRDISRSLNNFAEALHQSLANLKENRQNGLLLAVTVLGDVAAMITGLFFCFKALGIPVHAGVLITAFNFGITLTVISFIPGDLGVQEASIAGILVIFGVPFAEGILAAMLFRVLYYFAPFILSLGFYWGLLKESRQPQE